MPSPITRRLCLAVDLERYSSRDHPGQISAQRRLVDVLNEACRNACLNRQSWDRQPQGDGELALLPPGVDEPRVIADFAREMRQALFQRNRELNDTSRLRVRIAIHQGPTHVAANGYAGDAVVTVARLLNSKELKQALARHEQADLALVVSQEIYEDVIRHNYYDLRSSTFTQVLVSQPEKNFRARAWIHVSDHAPPRQAPAADKGGQRRNRERAKASPTTQYVMSQGSGGAAGRDVHHHYGSRGQADR